MNDRNPVHQHPDGDGFASDRCRTAREWLPFTSADLEDLPSDEVTAIHNAAVHAETCDGCRDFQIEQDRFDLYIDDAMHDVAIPAGLKERIEAQLATANSPNPMEDTRPPRWLGTRRLFNRRAAWTVATCLLLVLSITGGWWLSLPTLTMNDVHGAMAKLQNQKGMLDLAQLDSFDESFAISFADPRWRNSVAGAPLGLDCDDDGRDDAVVIPFELPRSRLSGSSLRGVLVMLPAGEVRAPPENGIPDGSWESYVPRPNDAWTSEGMVHVCDLESGTLDMLRRSLYRAAT